MVTAKVVVPLEIAVILAHVPVAPSLNTMNQAAIMKYRQIEATAVPGNQLGPVFLYPFKKTANKFGFGICSASKRPNAKIILVAQRARNRYNLLQMQLEKIVANSLTP